MTDYTSDQRASSPADRMGFSIVNAVIIALLLWVGSTLNESQVAVASLRVEITQLRVEMNRALENNTDQRDRLIQVESTVAQLKARSRL